MLLALCRPDCVGSLIALVASTYRAMGFVPGKPLGDEEVDVVWV